VIEQKLYFDDLEVGDGAETPGQTVTETDVIRYAGLTGEWEERSTSVEAAGALEPGTPVVPELLALCISSGLGWRGPKRPLAILAFMGLEWEFVRPLYVGDTIRSRSRAVAKRSVKDGGVVVEERQILNQRGEVVQSCKLTLLVAKRPVR